MLLAMRWVVIQNVKFDVGNSTPSNDSLGLKFVQWAQKESHILYPNTALIRKNWDLLNMHKFWTLFLIHYWEVLIGTPMDRQAKLE